MHVDKVEATLSILHPRYFNFGRFSIFLFFSPQLNAQVDAVLIAPPTFGDAVFVQEYNQIVNARRIQHIAELVGR